MAPVVCRAGEASAVFRLRPAAVVGGVSRAPVVPERTGAPAAGAHPDFRSEQAETAAGPGRH